MISKQSMRVSITRHGGVLMVVAAASLWVFGQPDSVRADDNTETCATRYPNAPTRPPPGYDHSSEMDAYMAFRRVARKAGFTEIKKRTREEAERGPCVGHGKHINLDGTRGKGVKWDHVGSITSCQICEETSRGPRLRDAVWQIHPDF